MIGLLVLAPVLLRLGTASGTPEATPLLRAARPGGALPLPEHYALRIC
ncbi:MAG: hypothetical protein U0527_04945 [Candidatus Eisenbacteria bacterium]